MSDEEFLKRFIQAASEAIENDEYSSYLWSLFSKKKVTKDE